MKNQKGFSLVELLVVVIIIGIIAAIAIPSLLASRKSANEASAAANLRTIHSAEVTHLATQNAFGDFASLKTQKLIDASWAANVIKNTYKYNLTNTSSLYCAVAEPAVATDKGFGVGTDGVIYVKVGYAAADCAAGVLDSTGTTVLGAN